MPPLCGWPGAILGLRARRESLGTFNPYQGTVLVIAAVIRAATAGGLQGVVEKFERGQDRGPLGFRNRFHDGLAPVAYHLVDTGAYAAALLRDFYHRRPPVCLRSAHSVHETAALQLFQDAGHGAGGNLSGSGEVGEARAFALSQDSEKRRLARSEALTADIVGSDAAQDVLGAVEFGAPGDDISLAGMLHAKEASRSICMSQANIKWREAVALPLDRPDQFIFMGALGLRSLEGGTNPFMRK